MIFRQITHDDLGCASYLVGDEKAGIAAVVDPRFEVDEYLELARYMGVRIEHVFETHHHADHVSAHGRPGALATPRLTPPGPRPGPRAFALIDTPRGDEPWAVLTGDTLFVNDVARP